MGMCGASEQESRSLRKTAVVSQAFPFQLNRSHASTFKCLFLSAHSNVSWMSLVFPHIILSAGSLMETEKGGVLLPTSPSIVAGIPQQLFPRAIQQALSISHEWMDCWKNEHMRECFEIQTQGCYGNFHVTVEESITEFCD